MRGNFCVDAGSADIAGRSCVWRGSELFFGRGSGDFCGDTSCSDSYRLLEILSLFLSGVVVIVCQGRVSIFHTNHPLVHFREFLEFVSQSIVKKYFFF